MIKAVLFDFGGVLVLGGKAGSIEQAVTRCTGVSAETLDIQDIVSQMRLGLISETSFFEEIARRHPEARPIKPEEYVMARDLFNKAENVYALAAKLRSLGLQTGILSNIFNINVAAIRKRNLYDGFDPVLLSCEVHLAKPDPEFYKLALKQIDLPAEQVAFVDDQQKCMPPAEELGIKTILAVSPEQIVKDLTFLIETENGISL